MRQMTIEEQISVIAALKHAEFWADMMVMDNVCYGNERGVRRCVEERTYARKVIEAFPIDILEGFVALKRKEAADALRAKADAIERGEA